ISRRYLRARIRRRTFRRRGCRVRSPTRRQDFLAEPREFSGARFSYVAAPDGVIIELLEHRQWAELTTTSNKYSGVWTAGISHRRVALLTGIGPITIGPSVQKQGNRPPIDADHYGTCSS